jgi:hypothetical protein
VLKKEVRGEAQTIENFKDESFDSYFEECAKDINLKIIDLNKIRDAIIESKENENVKNTMLVNIGYNMKSLLFRLLFLVVKGESFVNYDELMEMEDRNMAERKIL